MDFLESTLATTGWQGEALGADREFGNGPEIIRGQIFDILIDLLLSCMSLLDIFLSRKLPLLL